MEKNIILKELKEKNFNFYKDESVKLWGEKSQHFTRVMS